MGMTVYCDPGNPQVEIVSGVFISDGKPVEECPALTACQARMVPKDEEVADVYDGNAFGGEAEEEAGDSTVEKIPNLVKQFDLKQSDDFTINKKEKGSKKKAKDTFKELFMASIKRAMKSKKLKKKAKESDEGKAEFEKFKADSVAILNFVKKNLEDIGESSSLGGGGKG